VPFITISRQAGGGGWTLARRLAERLNELSGQEPPWTCWERELVEKVAADHNLSQTLIESLEEPSHSWLVSFFAGMSFSAAPDELTVFRRVAATIRALAQAGRVIIVGRGGVWITRGMPGGIHIRLIAPLSWRVRFMQRQWKVSADEAEARVLEMERRREAFYKQFFPREVMGPEVFALTLNTALIAEDKLVDCILPLVPGMGACAVAGGHPWSGLAPGS
jgi:cytidylate kinase